MSAERIQAVLHRRLGNYRWIPWAMVGALLVVVAVNGGLVFFALHTWPGLTTDHAYDEGLAYNRVIDEADKEAKLGWSVAIDFVPDAKGARQGRLVVEARDGASAPLRGLAVEAELARPVDQLAEIPLALSSDSDGRYSAVVALPRAGQWQVYIVARRDGAVYHTGRRILVP